MKQPIFKKDSPIDEKRISKIETVLLRLLRRSVKKITAMTTPYPISNCVVGEDVKGEILRYLFASRGVIFKGAVRIDKKLKAGARVTVTLAGDADESAHTYIMTGKTLLVKPDKQVYSCDRLIVSIDPIDPEEKITEAWICLMWAPDVKEVKMRSFLIDELDKIEPPEE